MKYKFKDAFNEAMDLGDTPDLFDPTKREFVEDPKRHPVRKLYPNLGKKGQSYFELLVSSGYKTLLGRLKFYTKKDITLGNLPSILESVGEAAGQIMGFEAEHKDELEKIALNVVLDMAEFKIIKTMVDAGIIKMDAKLDRPDLSGGLLDIEKAEKEAEEAEVTPAEAMNMELAEELIGDTDHALRRKLANAITQGNAVNKLYLFNNVLDELNAINPRLIPLYGLLTSGAQLTYYTYPMMKLTRGIINPGAVGSEKVIPDEDGENGVYTIKARGICFPYLVHEIVKGIYDYLSMDITTDKELSQETFDDELADIMSGAELYRIFSAHASGEDAQYLPFVFKLFLRLPEEQIKEVLLGGGRGAAIMKKMIADAKQSWTDFNATKEEPGYQDGDGGSGGPFSSDIGGDDDAGGGGDLPGDEWKNQG